MFVDQLVLDWVVSHRNSDLTIIFKIVTIVGDTPVMLGITVLLTMLLTIVKKYQQAANLAGAMLLGWCLMNILKLIFARERPPVDLRLVMESTYSLPSGHAMMSAVLATVLARIAFSFTESRNSRRIIIFSCATLSLCIGFSRIYLGAHWFSDVVLGWVLGCLWAGLWTWGSHKLLSLRIRRILVD
ncbi:MAG: phosphatase PAP2 family protein [Mycobacteriaceae bacterium]